MTPYPKYKPSGIEWIGDIPEHWEVKRMKYLAVGINTLFLDGDWIESKNIVFDEENIRYITTGNIGEGKFKEQGGGYITEETFEKLNCTEVFPGDLVISRLNPPIGRACIIPDFGKRIVTSVDNVILRPSSKYLKQFLVHFFSNVRYFDFTLIEGRGATMQRISRSILGNIHVVVPKTIEEQTAIADYLDKKTTAIDELIANKEQLLKLYEEEKTALINHAVTKGLNPDAPIKDSGIAWLGEIPEHWEVKKLKYVAKMKGGFAFSSKDFCADGVQLIKIANLYNNNLDLTRQPTFLPTSFVDNHSDWVVNNKDILMSMTGTLGKRDYGFAIIVNEAEDVFLLNQRVSKFYSISGLVPELLLFCLRSEYFLNSIFSIPAGTKQGNLSNEDVLNQIIVFPSEATEQQSIVDYIEAESKKIEAQIARTRKLIDLLTEYRTALISEVVTGKIKVTN